VITAPRAALALAAALLALTATLAYAASPVTLAPGETVDIGCGGPSLVWSQTNGTSGVASCATNPTTTPPPTTTTTTAAPAWWKPGPITSWQWQLSGTIDTTKAVQVYDVDWETSKSVVDTLHARGIKVICYVDVAYENYRPDAGDFPAAVLGGSIGGWPAERYVDVRKLDSPAGSTGKTLRQIMANRFQACADKGFDAVETDLDAEWPDATGFSPALTRADYEAYDTQLAGEIHNRGMAWFLKNGITGTPFIANMASLADGTVNEECWAYNECGELQPFVNAGKPILSTVYTGQQATICPKATAFPMATMRKKTSLDASVTWKCWP
jgi:hypothetical protein